MRRTWRHPPAGDKHEIFLGSFDKYDLYYQDCGCVKTVLARFGDAPEDYLTSTPGIRNIAPLAEASCRAVNIGCVAGKVAHA